MNFQGARTKYFDDYFRQAAAAGVRQIVLLAAGLDSRAYRLRWPDGTVVFELDQPRVLEFKREVLAGMATRRWPSAARSRSTCATTGCRHCADQGFDPSKPSAWIAEGLLIYLPADAQQQLFSGIDALASPGSWLAVEEASPMPRQLFEARRDEERAAGHDETFFTLVYNEQVAPADAIFGTRLGPRRRRRCRIIFVRSVGPCPPTTAKRLP